MHERAGVSVFTNVSPPGSRGEIRLRSADPAEAPVIEHRLFGDPADMAAIIRGLKGVENIFAAPALARHVTGRNVPAEKPRSDDEWADQVRAFAGVGYHPVGTCRMGGDETSVVDPQLRVRGISGLRVIDASIMPRMPAANTNAPSIMIGEKGADLVIRGKMSR
jgi:choline dehydrogenase